MDRTDDNIDEDVAAATKRLVKFAFVPRTLAYLSRLDITDRITFSERTVVICGAFGDITIGQCNIRRRRRVKIAVKRLRLHLKEDIKLLLEKEVYVWSKLNHANVLPLLGYAFDKDSGFPMLISEWMKNGTAWTYVTSNPYCDLLRLIMGLARGLAYLHENDIIHSDIKSDNVLVSDPGDALICDFGFARMLNASRSLGSMSVGGEGTPQYLAYELLADPNKYSTHSKASDVWAFGVTVYIPLRIMQGELLEFPTIPISPHSSSLTDLLRTICEKCWILQPKARADMTKVLDILQKEMDSRLFQSSTEVEGAHLENILPRLEHHAVAPSTEPQASGYKELPYNYRARGERDPRDAREARLFERIEFPSQETRKREREARDRDEQNVKRSKANPPSSTFVDHFSNLSTPVASSSSFLSPPQSTTPTTYSSPTPPPSGSTFLGDLNLNTLPADYKKEGADWFAVFNPKLKRELDIDLTHTLAHESVVCCVRFSADGKYLATGCNRTAQIYDTKTGQKIRVLNDENASPVGDLYIRSVCFSPDGKLLATGAGDKTIRIWEIAKKRVKRVFEGHTLLVCSLDFSKNGRFIVSGSEDRTARIWDMETGMHKVLEAKEPDDITAGVTSVAISPNGRLVAAGSFDNVVRIWEVQSGNLIEKLLGHRDSVYSVAFTPDGKGIVSGSLDNTLKHWDISAIVNGSRRDPIATPSTPTSSLGNGSGNAIVRAKDGGERESVNTLNFTGHKDYVLSVAISNDGQWVVSGSKDKGVRFWGAHTAQVQLMLQGHKNSVISVDLSPTGGMLATGSGDMQARIWRYSTI